MRRSLSLLLLGAAALGTVAASPAPAMDTDTDTDDVIVCVRFRDWPIPLTGITVERPAERFCVESGELPGQQQ